MVSNTVPPSGDEPRSLRYVCETCRTPLLLPASRVGTSGPCPKCGKWIDASKFVFPEIPASHAKAARIAPDATPPARKRRESVTSGRGRMRADGYIDHDYSDRKELYGTLRVLAVFAAVGAVILLVFLYMRQWMLK